MAKMTGYGLTLTTEENERGSNDVFVEDDRGNCASYGCAINEGYLGAGSYPWTDRKLTRRQMDWLDSPKVEDWLEANDY